MKQFEATRSWLSQWITKGSTWTDSIRGSDTMLEVTYVDGSVAYMSEPTYRDKLRTMPLSDVKTHMVRYVRREK